MSHLAFLGLGAMGSRMAAHLAVAHDLIVWNRSPGRPTPDRARRAPTPRAAAAGAEAVFSMLTDDGASRAVWLDPVHGALEGLAPGALVVVCSTLSPGWAQELAGLVAARGARLLESPVAGSTPQAEAAALVCLLGGEAADVARAEPWLATFSARRVHVGAVGQGSAFKLMVNALFATQVAVWAELLSLGARHGIEPARARALLAATPVSSPAAAGVAALMVAADHAPRFPVSLVAKDLRYAGAAGAGPVVASAGAAFAALAEAGRGAANLSAIYGS